MNIDTTDWAGPVLNFWFEELSKKDWFMSSTELDKTIIDRFSTTHQAISTQPASRFVESGHKALAAIIVLDQFSRNMFRGSADAFTYDAQALSIAKLALQQDLHVKLSNDEQQFMCMPFMHSENLADQAQSLTLFTQLNLQEHALEHHAIIEQFGRFPHRNDLLGRASTEAEIEYLKDARRFGQ